MSLGPSAVAATPSAVVVATAKQGVMREAVVGYTTGRPDPTSTRRQEGVSVDAITNVVGADVSENEFRWTTLYHPKSQRPAPISEAVGAYYPRHSANHGDA